MKKTKKLLIITILLSILISIFAIKSLYVEAADVKRTLTITAGQRPYINLSEWDIVCSNNVYCVTHALNLHEASAKITVSAKVEIRGENASYETYLANGSVKTYGTSNSSLNHEMAAVLNHAGYADADNMTGYGDAGRFTVNRNLCSR